MIAPGVFDCVPSSVPCLRLAAFPFSDDELEKAGLVGEGEYLCPFAKYAVGAARSSELSWRFILHACSSPSSMSRLPCSVQESPNLPRWLLT